MKITARMLGLAVAAVAASCSFVAEFAGMTAPVVRGFLPAEEFVRPEEITEIAVEFSAEMRVRSVEEAFAAAGDFGPLPGGFRWTDGNSRLHFIPLAPLRDNSSYTVTVSGSAEDRYGNSLAEDFKRVFHTRAELERPRVLSVSPEPEAVVSDRRVPIRITFSEPMDAGSAAAAFSLSPAAAGYFSFEGAVIVFTPLEDYREGETYSVLISGGASDLSGNTLAREFSTRFHMVERSRDLIAVETFPGGASLTEPAPGDFVDASLGIEKDQKFRLRFSGAVPPEERRFLVSVTPFVPFRLAWDADFSAALLEFSEHLRWGEIYELRIADATRRFIVNGEGSVPLGIEGVFYIRDTREENPVRERLVFAYNYEFPPSEDAAFEVVVRHGAGAAPVLSSFLAAFSISPGAAGFDILPFRVETIPIGPEETLFRLGCEISSVIGPGVLTLEVGSELRDDRDNRLGTEYALVVNKL